MSAEVSISAAALPGVRLLSARLQDFSFPDHFHDEQVFGTVEAGVGLFRIHGATHLHGPGGVLLIAPGDVHSYERHSPTPLSYRSIYVERSTLLGLVDGGEPRFELDEGLLAAGIAHDMPLAAGLLGLHRRLQRGSALESEVALLDFLALVHRHRRSLPVRRESAGEHSIAVRRALDYLHAKYSEKVHLAELAHVAGLSKFHFVRIFRLQTGTSPHSYLIGVRIERAKKRLEQGESPVEVALACGFSDQSHLTNVFKRVIGTSPCRYVRSLRRQ